MKSIKPKTDTLAKEIHPLFTEPTLSSKPVKYFLINSKSTEEFIDAVNSHLEDGWELYGNTFMGARKHSYENGGTIIRDLLMQAVVKYGN